MKTHTRNGLLFIAGCVGAAALLWVVARGPAWRDRALVEADASSTLEAASRPGVGSTPVSEESLADSFEDRGVETVTADQETALQLMINGVERQQLENGQDLVMIKGRVINPTASALPVPPLHAEVRDGDGNVVNRWTIAPPAKELAAGASISFDSTEVDVSPGGTEVTVTID